MRIRNACQSHVFPQKNYRLVVTWESLFIELVRPTLKVFDLFRLQNMVVIHLCVCYFASLRISHQQSYKSKLPKAPGTNPESRRETRKVG